MPIYINRPGICQWREWIREPGPENVVFAVLVGWERRGPADGGKNLHSKCNLWHWRPFLLRPQAVYTISVLVDQNTVTTTTRLLLVDFDTEDSSGRHVRLDSRPTLSSCLPLTDLHRALLLQCHMYLLRHISDARKVSVQISSILEGQSALCIGNS